MHHNQPPFFSTRDRPISKPSITPFFFFFLHSLSLSVSTMLSRYIFKPSHLRILTLLSSKPLPNPTPISSFHRFYSSNNGSNKDLPELWNLASTTDPTADSLFPQQPTSPNHPPHHIKPQSLGNGNGDGVFKKHEFEGRGVGGGVGFDRDGKKGEKVESWGVLNEGDGGGGVFKKGGEVKGEKVESWGVGDEDGDDIFKKGGGQGDWEGGNGVNSWDFSVGAEEEGRVEDELFRNVEMKGGDGFGLEMVQEKGVDMKQLEAEEKGLVAILKGIVVLV